jgi:hypothetical protein
MKENYKKRAMDSNDFAKDKKSKQKFTPKELYLLMGDILDIKLMKKSS